MANWEADVSRLFILGLTLTLLAACSGQPARNYGGVSYGMPQNEWPSANAGGPGTNNFPINPSATSGGGGGGNSP